MTWIQLPCEVFELALAYPDDHQLSMVRVTSCWLKYACGRQYKKRALKASRCLHVAVELGLPIPSWYRLHRALTADTRGVQSGRRLDLRSIMSGCFEWLNVADHEKLLNEFVIICAVGFRGRTYTSQNSWRSFDGTPQRLPLSADNKPVYTVLTGPAHQCGQNCKCGTIWKELHCLDGWSSEICKMVPEIAVYHRKLGFAQWVEDIGPYGIDHESLRSDEQGPLEIDTELEQSQQLVDSQSVQQAIAQSETLRFNSTRECRTFAGNIDTSSIGSHIDGESYECGASTVVAYEFAAKACGENWEISLEAISLGIDPGPYDYERTDEDRRTWYLTLQSLDIRLPHLLASQLSWLPE